jgi:hypothetical protein
MAGRYIEAAKPITTWKLELRNADGNELGTDRYQGTYEEAFADAKNWLAEMKAIGNPGIEMLVINDETEEVVYQGDFGLFEAVEMSNIEDPATQERLLAAAAARNQSDRESEDFYERERQA